MYCWGLKSTISGIILCMRPANERWLYNVTSPLIGWVPTKNAPCYICIVCSADKLFVSSPGVDMAWTQEVLSPINCLLVANKFAQEAFMDLLFVSGKLYIDRADSGLCPAIEMALLCNNVSHWLGASLESALIYMTSIHKFTVLHNPLCQHDVPKQWCYISTMASEITSNLTVYSTVYSG